MATKQIPIDKLVPGMFLVGVDIGWLETPFLRHKFLIKSDAQVQKLRACNCKLVTIDTDRGADAEPEPEAAPETAPEPVAEPTPAAAPEPAPEPTPQPAPAPTPAPTAKPAAAQPAAAKPAPSEELSVPTAPTSYATEHARVKKIKGAATQLMNKAVEDIRNGGKIEKEAFAPIIEHTLGASKRNGMAVLTLLSQTPKTQGMVQHAFNQSSLATLLGERMGLVGDQLRRLGMAAMFMDIGWVNVPQNLLRQQMGAYTDDEYDMVSDHVAHTVELLDRAEFDPDVIRTVEQHHERYDGGGYPDGLAGAEIPLEAQILSIVSHYEGTVHGLYDSAPRIPVKALQQIYQKAMAGGHDIELVKQFIHLLGIYPISSAVKLNTGEKGIVVRVNWKNPKAPRVRIIYGRGGKALPESHEVDLSMQGPGEKRAIETVIDPRVQGVDPRGLLVMYDD